LAAIDAITAEIKASPYGPAAYLKVQMRSEALAKSYRPVGWVFKPDQFPCVGADAVGTLYFRAPLIYMRVLRQRIGDAELAVAIKRRKRDDMPYKAPTAARAEVGAIDTIEITPPEEKRTFSTAAAMSMLADPRTVSGYHIELFETPSAPEIADDPRGGNELRRSLEQLVLSFGEGTRAYFSAVIGRTPVLEMQLTSGAERALIDNRVGIVGGDGAGALSSAEIDRTPARHEAALSALQRHPLVRAIRPPVQLQLTEDQAAAGLASVDGAPLVMPKPAQGARYPIVGVIDSGVADVLADWVVDRFDYLAANEYDTSHGTGVAAFPEAFEIAEDGDPARPSRVRRARLIGGAPRLVEPHGTHDVSGIRRRRLPGREAGWARVRRVVAQRAAREERVHGHELIDQRAQEAPPSRR
jgi:hypothetical protein